jgi:hypothetical protein
MRKLLMIGAVTAALLLPAASHAQFTLGARVGYGFGLGDVADTTTGPLEMSDWNEGQVPIQLDALFRLSPQLALGAYASYGFAVTGDVCDELGADCDGSGVTRVGLQAIYTLATTGTLAPWFGVGAGYEWNTLDDGFNDVTYKGWEYLNLQAGGDFRVGQQFWVGPYVMFSLGQYSDVESEGVSGIFDEEIADEAMHQWLSFGLRGKFDL